MSSKFSDTFSFDSNSRCFFFVLFEKPLNVASLNSQCFQVGSVNWIYDLRRKYQLEFSYFTMIRFATDIASLMIKKKFVCSLTQAFFYYLNEKCKQAYVFAERSFLPVISFRRQHFGVCFVFEVSDIWKWRIKSFPLQRRCDATWHSTSVANEKLISTINDQFKDAFSLNCCKV